jgi:hypothetical protein
MAPFTQATRVVQNIAATPRERVLQKVYRTLLGVGLGATIHFLQPFPPGAWRNGAWVVVGVLLAGEWVLLPVKLLAAVIKDSVAPAITALRGALTKKEDGKDG